MPMMGAMRAREAFRRAVMITVAAAFSPAWAQEAFDACDVFTAEIAEKALGTAAAPEPVNPKVKRPKVVTTCTYTGAKDGKPVAASAQFRFAKNDAEMK